MKSTKQVADELQVSIRTVQRYIKKLNILTQGQGISDTDFKAIQQAINDKAKRQATGDDMTATRQCDKLNDEISEKKAIGDTTATRQCDSLDSNNATDAELKIELLQVQIQQMQQHIDDLRTDKEKLYKLLETERMEKQTILAKYLVMNEEQEEQQEEVKATVVESEPVKAEQEPTEQEEQPQKKQGFWARLFRKDK